MRMCGDMTMHQTQATCLHSIVTTHSSVIEENGFDVVNVRFERPNENGFDFLELIRFMKRTMD